MYWLLTGNLPNGADPVAIRKTHDSVDGRKAPPSLREHRREIDRDLEAICQRAMAIRPDERIGSAAEFATGLEAWLRREPIPWTQPSVLRRLRLWTKRKPAVAAAVVLVAVVVAASGASLLHLGSVAREKRIEAALARSRLEQEEQYRQAFRGKLRDMVASLREAREKGMTHQVLPQIWLGEWLFGPTVLGDGPERFELWDLRIEVVGDELTKTRARGERTLQTLTWESALGYWLLNAGRYEDAKPLLTGNAANWRAILDPQDPWILHMQAMLACAVVGLATEPEASDLQAAASTLAQEEQLLQQYEWGTPLHHLVLVHLRKVYGPSLLDRPQELADVEARLQEVNK